MKGLKNKYFLRKKQLLIDLVNSGNNIIINGSWHIFPKYNLNKKINYIKSSVKSGEIKQEKIDKSVQKILNAKGYKVIN